MDEHTWENVGRRMCQSYGLFHPSDEDVEHMAVLAQAFSIFRDRQMQYQSLWKASGSEDNAFHVKSKAQRMLVAEGQTAADDALDAINYAAFYFNNKREGR